MGKLGGGRQTPAQGRGRQVRHTRPGRARVLPAPIPRWDHFKLPRLHFAASLHSRGLRSDRHSLAHPPVQRTWPSASMTAIASLVFCTDCGNLLDSNTGRKAYIECDLCGTQNKGKPFREDERTHADPVQTPRRRRSPLSASRRRFQAHCAPSCARMCRK